MGWRWHVGGGTVFMPRCSSAQRSEGRSANRLCPGWERSVMMLPVRFFTLELSWSWAGGHQWPKYTQNDMCFTKHKLCNKVWYGNSSNQDCKALQRVVHLAERISGSALPSLQDIYLKRCKSRAAKILKDSTHPGNHLFCLLPSGKRFRSMMAKTERLRRSFFPQAIRLLNTNPVS